MSGGSASAEAGSSILVVDDEPQVLRVVTRVLEGGGFQVTAVESGLDAVSLLEKRTFDAVLTDVVMPKMTGMELLRAIRQRDLEVPVIVMTGGPEVQSAADSVRYGACGYVVKPFEPEKLREVVRRAVELNAVARLKRESMRALESGRPEAGDRAGLEVTLDRALASLWMAYQPIVDPATRSVFGYEALLRSTEPALPNPGAVIDAATRLGRIQEIGRTVWSRVPESTGGAPDGTVFFVNLLARDLADDTLTSSRLSSMASRVILEITERSSLDEVPAARTMVAELRALGFRIAIDDLGAGYAGLNSFAILEPNFVKLDISLVRDVHESSVKQKLVRSMTKLCRDMGVMVVAEGIEKPEERDMIIELGCDLLQGYLLARPGKPFPAVEKWA